jgi:negative regulator of flagellin synthesis FlgM
MTSRIDGNQGAPLSTQVDRAEAAKATERAQNQAKAAKADRVELSSDAALMQSAVQAANDAPAVRADKVEAAKKALADGSLGADAGKLADALIDHMLDDKK